MVAVNTKGLSLGQKVKDTIAGVEGMAVGRAMFMFGCSRITIQPPVLKDGSLPESVVVDDQRVKAVDARPKLSPFPTFKYPFGAIVKDSVSGFEGMVTAHHEHISGSLECEVSPTKLSEKGALMDSYWINEKRLVLVKAAEPVKTEPTSISRSGGPQNDRKTSMKGNR